MTELTEFKFHSKSEKFFIYSENLWERLKQCDDARLFNLGQSMKVLYLIYPDLNTCAYHTNLNNLNISLNYVQSKMWNTGNTET